MEASLDRMLDLQARNELTPKYKATLAKILTDHPPVEIVDVRNSRYAQIAKSAVTSPQVAPLGGSLDEVIRNVRTQLVALRQQTERMNTEFRNAISVAEQGGFAAFVLSGRATFPELVMQNEELVTIFERFYGRACLTTISATMEVYPDGLGWLPKPQKK